jgi:hypothetical protein
MISGAGLRTPGKLRSDARNLRFSSEFFRKFGCRKGRWKAGWKVSVRQEFSQRQHNATRYDGQVFAGYSPRQPMNVRHSRRSGKNPRSNCQNLIGFLEVMLGAEQPNVCSGQTASAFRKRNVVIEMQILG